MSTAVAEIRHDLEKLKPQIELVLPAHVTPDKFMRVVLTAIQQNPELMKVEKRSLFSATMKCAQDGLLPDGQEAAFVTFRTKDGPRAQYMPMVRGILKKVRNSGELSSIVANVVMEKDVFRYWIDDAGEHVTHEPNLLEERGKLIAVYAIAKTKDGGVYTEVMTRGQIEQVRAVSKAKDSGPWQSWYDEMARKTVIRRLSKRLPMSTDLEAVIKRDDSMYEVQQRTAAKSGVDAAKALLGLATAEVGSVDDDEPAFDVAAAKLSLEQAGDLGSLKLAWGKIVDHFSATDAEVPLELEATYKLQSEALA